MRRSSKTGLAAVCGAALMLAAPAVATATEALYGVTDRNRLIRFNADSPGNPLSNVLIKGMAQNEVVVGMDVRPENDQLYVVTNQSRIHYVNPVTGDTRTFFADPFTPGLNGTSFGVDFNPVGHALRLTSDAEQNLRIRWADGQVFADNALAYAPGDPGAGTDPSVGAVAYTSSVPGATTTALYGIDSARDVLVRINPPNDGVLTTVGALGVDAPPLAGFDIAATGDVAYAAFQTAGSGPVNLHRIDLATGKASPAVAQPEIREPSGAGVLRDIATAGVVDDDDRRPQSSTAFSSTILEQNTDTLRPSVSCNETCTVSISATVDGLSAGSASETIVGAGRETVEVRLNAAARRRIDSRGTELIRLRIRATDAAGNVSSQERVSRTQTLEARRSG